MTLKKPIYMDHHATTPVDSRVLEAMLPYFTEKFGNAASIDHPYGSEALEAVERGREEIAKTINCRPEEIIFTSGATESDNLAILGIAERHVDKGNHIITCATEHKAILDSCKRLESLGKRVTYLSVDKYGIVDLNALESSITDKTILISIMTANNEIGTIAPVEEIGRIASEHGILFHTDAAQAVGHIPMDVDKMNTHMMSMSAHKVYGPKGMGALYVRRSNPRAWLSPIIFGGGHERGMRSGTLNVPGIVGFAKALEIARKEMREENKRLGGWRDEMFKSFQESINAELNGHPIQRLAHNLNIFIPGIENKALVNLLKDDLSISTGSACTTAKTEPSHVITALGYGEERAYSTIRFGLGRFNVEKEVFHVIELISKYAKQLMQISIS